MHVACLMSHVICLMSHVTFLGWELFAKKHVNLNQTSFQILLPILWKSNKIFLFCFDVRVCYQRGLPCLVFIIITNDDWLREAISRENWFNTNMTGQASDILSYTIMKKKKKLAVKQRNPLFYNLKFWQIFFWRKK